VALSAFTSKLRYSNWNPNQTNCLCFSLLCYYWNWLFYPLWYKLYLEMYFMLD
jgi:hypothetical protein